MNQATQQPQPPPQPQQPDDDASEPVEGGVFRMDP